MTMTMHAQPYDMSATGFYFETAEEFGTKAKALKNSYGQPVEEFEIQFIDGNDIDCALAVALGVNQANLAQFFDSAEEWDDEKKIKAVLAVGDCGYTFDAGFDPDALEIDVYQIDNLRDLAEQFLEEGLFGEVPTSLEYYIDIDAIARDLAADYSETTVAGQRLVYRCN